MPQLAPGLLPDTGNPGHPPPDLHFFPSQAAILSEMPQDDGTTVTPSAPSAAVLPEPSRRERTQQTLTWLGVGGACLWLLAQLSPILTPFLAAIILAYIFSPAVDALARRGLPRPLGSLLAVVVLSLIVAGLLLILVPVVHQEMGRIAERIPQGISLFNEQVSPWLAAHLNVEFRLNAQSLQQLANDNGQALSQIAKSVLGRITDGGAALIAFLSSLALLPVVLFYILLDWHKALYRIDEILPRRLAPLVRRLAREIDDVLGQFLRGQLSVMLLLACYYSGALWLAGLDLALPVGILTGLLVFIPYVGFGIGLILGLLSALLQFQGMELILWVSLAYGIGQLLEGFLLTPYLVGEKIGLHPVAVIFALLAFGQLFGFLGVLLALPASAMLLVGLRELRQAYLSSDFYRRT